MKGNYNMDEKVKKELDKDNEAIDGMCIALKDALNKLGYQSMIVAAKIIKGEHCDNMKMHIVNSSSLKVMASAIHELFKSNKKLPLLVALEGISDSENLENKLEEALDAIIKSDDDLEPENKTLQ